ncbi:MAG TPA: hypothetical protein VMU96_08910 [Casimicrobiaceae bacterium]|nr:hypothetical protein [Casimicrobiaceae bacterium]
MDRLVRLVFTLSAAAALAAAAPALAQKADPAPKRETYLCPHSDANAIDCYLDAVDHLYTMCRVTKSIEILEFGYEKSEEGVNGAKTEYCIDKHNLTMKQTYDAAVKQAGKNRAVTEALNSLREYWRSALVALKWIPGESDEQYKARTAEPYGVFRQRALLVRQAMAAAPPAEKAPATASAKSPPKPKSAASASAKSSDPPPKASN